MATRRLTQRGRDRRRQLMDFAARRFAEGGYDPTSVTDIVTGLGVGKGVFYWYFPSKEALLAEILREAQHDLRRRQAEAIAGRADPVDRIEAGIRASMRWFAGNRHLVTLFQFAASDERFAPLIRRGQEVAVGDLVRHVKEAVVAGRVRDEDPLLLAHAVLGVAAHLARTFVHERGEDPDAVADATVAFCLGGLGA